MNKNSIVLAGLALVVGVATTVYVMRDRNAPSTEQAKPAADWCVEHEIAEAECPFCDTSLVEELGWCDGHDVPEAHCTRCNSRLIAAFKSVGDWCAEHGLPESQCRVCNPNVKSDGKVASAGKSDDWCAEHEIASSECPICDPSLVEKLGWCGGHDVPEAYCTRCNARLIPTFKAIGDWCAEHALPESQCKVCNPDATGVPNVAARPGAGPAVAAEDVPRDRRPPAVRCKTNDLQVRFASADIARKAGLVVSAVERRRISATITCNAEVAFDGNHYAQISSRVSGVVQAVKKDLGDRVAKGDVLVLVDSAELAAAKADLLRRQALLELARKNHERIHGLVLKGISTEQDDLESEARLEEARVAGLHAEQKLHNLGLTRAQIGEIADMGETSSSLAVTAPFDATIVERSAVVGEAVEAYRPLFALANTSVMWAMLDIYESDLAQVRVGQPVVFSVDGLPGEHFGGTITWISASVDHRTRTLKARAELGNGSGLLRANMFGRAVVTVHDAQPVTIVPKSAVQWEGCCNVVFVKMSDVLFVPRKVRLGYAADDYYEVIEGVEPGEPVVTRGSFLLKTELMSGSIGQGCCEVDPGSKR